MIRALIITVLTLQAGFAEEPAAFSRAIAPILQAKCLGCHGAEKAKGGYRVHTFGALFQPGKSKESPLVAGQPASSELFKRLTTSDPDDRMPQKDEPLPPEQIELFRTWIASGAALDRGDTNTPIVALVPKPPYPAPPERYRRPLPILSLAFAPDGAQIAVSGSYEVTFWNLRGELTRRLTNVPQRVRSLTFDRSGNFLALAGGQPGRSGDLRIYNLENGQCETNLLSIADEILCVASSPDGKWLACGGTDNSIHLFDWEKRTRSYVIQQHADWVIGLDFNTDGTQIASASRDRTARVYDVASGNLEATYTGQTVPLNVIAFLPTGYIVSGGRDKTLHVWDAKDSKKKGEMSGLAGDAYALLATPDFTFVAGADGAIRQYANTDRKNIRSFTGQPDAIFALACDPKTEKLASGSYDGSVSIWNINDGTLLHRFIAAPGWRSLH